MSLKQYTMSINSEIIIEPHSEELRKVLGPMIEEVAKRGR